MDTPLTSSTGSQPIEWSTSSSSMDRSEVIRAVPVAGAFPSAPAAARISALMSTLTP
jgi:hypothetical protein